MREYKCLKLQDFKKGDIAIVPIREEDKYIIMQMRNEQMFHLRQAQILTKNDQDNYFEKIVALLFEHETPGQILFSYLQNGECIGYGGLVHINWKDKNAEISFIIKPELENEYFKLHWTTFLGLLENVAFKEIGLHKIYTYAFDIRDYLYPVLLENDFNEEARLKEHFYSESYKDVVIHSKINSGILLRKGEIKDIQITYEWASNNEIRKYSFNQAQISKDDHGGWYRSKLSDSNCRFFIAEKNGLPIGSIRFEIKEHTAIVSYLIAPEFHGHSYGKTVLFKGAQELIQDSYIQTIIGYVMKDNIASLKAFERLGYTGVEEVSQIKFIKKFK